MVTGPPLLYFAAFSSGRPTTRSDRRVSALDRGVSTEIQHAHFTNLWPASQTHCVSHAQSAIQTFG